MCTAFDTSNMTNKLLKCNLMYWFELFFISFDTFDMRQLVLYYIHTTLQDSMQHGPSTPPTCPGSCETCFFHIPVLSRKSFLIFTIIYLVVGLISHLHICLLNLVNPLISDDSNLDDTISHFGGFFFSFSWSVGS